MSSESKNRDIDIVFRDGTLESGEIRYGAILIGSLRGERWSNKSKSYNTWILVPDSTLSPDWNNGYRFFSLNDAAAMAFAVHIVSGRITVNVKTASGKTLDSTKG